jgi:integral membrane protein (TIGR01906 family)
MKKLIEVIEGAAFFLLAAALLLSVIDAVCFNRSFYQRAYQEADTAEEIGMSEEDLMEATEVLLDYLQDERDDIDYEAEVNGYERTIYSTREEAHMEDVKALYQNAMTVRNILYAIVCVLLVIGILMDRKLIFHHLFEGWRYGMVLALLCIGFISLLAAVDFYDFWINFHELFFDNDLYYLDPNTSIMINMFPENFFVQMVAVIIIVTVVLSVAIGLVLYGCKRKEKKHAECRSV